MGAEERRDIVIGELKNWWIRIEYKVNGQDSKTSEKYWGWPENITRFALDKIEVIQRDITPNFDSEKIEIKRIEITPA